MANRIGPSTRNEETHYEKKKALPLSHQYYGDELAGDFENVTHQSNPRKDKRRVNDVPIMQCQDVETERR